MSPSDPWHCWRSIVLHQPTTLAYFPGRNALIAAPARANPLVPGGGTFSSRWVYCRGCPLCSLLHLCGGESRTWVHTCWFGLAAGLINITTFFTCSVSMNAWELAAMFGLAWLIEFCDVALSCFTLSRLTTFPDVSLIKPEDSFSPLFKAVLYSVSWVRKLVNWCGSCSFATELVVVAVCFCGSEVAYFIISHQHQHSCIIAILPWWFAPTGRSGMSDLTALSWISGLSFDFHSISSLVFCLIFLLYWYVVFLLMVHFPDHFFFSFLFPSRKFWNIIR